MKVKKLNLQGYDLFEVMKRDLSFSDVVALDWINENIKSGRLVQEDLGKKYYIFSIVRMYDDIGKYGVCSKDAYTVRLKNLAKKGYLEIVNGNFYTPEFGFCRMCIRLGKEYKNLLRGEE